jgi:hypothetical protein
MKTHINAEEQKTIQAGITKVLSESLGNILPKPELEKVMTAVHKTAGSKLKAVEVDRKEKAVAVPAESKSAHYIKKGEAGVVTRGVRRVITSALRGMVDRKSLTSLKGSVEKDLRKTLTSIEVARLNHIKRGRRPATVAKAS